MGTDKAFGSVVIRRSDDCGKTWTTPKDSTSGLLLPGRFVTSPVPVVVHERRIWRSIEQPDQTRTLAMVASAPIDADLLKSDSWTISAPTAMEPNHFGRKNDRFGNGNLVAHPKAGLVDMLSVSAPRGDIAAILPVSTDGERISYEPSMAFIDFPGGRLKFTVRYDPRSDKFWAISNRQHDPFAGRNHLVLSSSNNLRKWEMESTLLRHVDSIWHGFHHADWQFDGDDLVAVIQTSWDGAKNSTQSNYLTFHRIKNFRSLDPAQSSPLYGRVKRTRFAHSDFEVTGSQFSVADFKEDAIAFTRYQLKFKQVPRQLDGWKFTRTVPGSPVEMKLRIKRDCDLFMMTAATGGGVIDVTGWTSVDSPPFYYSDQSKTKMALFSRTAKRGETIEIPQGNWTGGMLLIPPESEATD